MPRLEVRWKRGRRLFGRGKTIWSLLKCGRWDGWDGHPELPLQAVEKKGQLCRAVHFSLLTVEGAWTSLPALGLLKLSELNPTLANAARCGFYVSPVHSSSCLTPK